MSAQKEVHELALKINQVEKDAFAHEQVRAKMNKETSLAAKRREAANRSDSTCQRTQQAETIVGAKCAAGPRSTTALCWFVVRASNL